MNDVGNRAVVHTEVTHAGIVRKRLKAHPLHAEDDSSIGVGQACGDIAFIRSSACSDNCEVWALSAIACKG